MGCVPILFSLRAESKFRRVKGYKEIPQLLAVLHNKSIDRKVVAA
jgi:hypothetical protein